MSIWVVGSATASVTAQNYTFTGMNFGTSTVSTPKISAACPSEVALGTSADGRNNSEHLIAGKRRQRFSNVTGGRTGG